VWFSYPDCVVLSLLPPLPSNSNLWNTPYMQNSVFNNLSNLSNLRCLLFIYLYFFCFFFLCISKFSSFKYNLLFFFCYLIRYFFLFFQYFTLCLKISLAASNFLNYIWSFLCTKACYPHVWFVGLHHLSKSGKRDWLITRPTWSVGMFLQ